MYEESDDWPPEAAEHGMDLGWSDEASEHSMDIEWWQCPLCHFWHEEGSPPCPWCNQYDPDSAAAAAVDSGVASASGSAAFGQAASIAEAERDDTLAEPSSPMKRSAADADSMGIEVAFVAVDVWHATPTAALDAERAAAPTAQGATEDVPRVPEPSARKWKSAGRRVGGGPGTRARRRGVDRGARRRYSDKQDVGWPEDCP